MESSTKRPPIPRFTVKCAGPVAPIWWVIRPDLRATYRQGDTSHDGVRNEKDQGQSRDRSRGVSLRLLWAQRKMHIAAVLDALSLARRDTLSPTKAAKAAARRSRRCASTRRRIEERLDDLYVKPTDRLPRRMRMFTSQGEVVVRTTSSRTATRSPSYNNAVREYVLTARHQ